MTEHTALENIPPTTEIIVPEETLHTPVALEELIKKTEGLSHVMRFAHTEDGKQTYSWRAVGSWGRSGIAVDGSSPREAVKALSEQPYHLDHELGRKKYIASQPSDEDLLVRAIALGKTEEELLEEANINNIKYNWEVKQAIPVDTSWIVYGGNGKTVHSYHANSMGDALAKAWVYGTKGIKKIGEDDDNFYLANYLPGLGIKHIANDHFGYNGLETIVRKADIRALLDGGNEKMFQ